MKRLLALFAFFASLFIVSQASAANTQSFDAFMSTNPTAQDIAIEYYKRFGSNWTTVHSGFNDPLFDERPDLRESVFDIPRDVFLWPKTLYSFWWDLFHYGELLSRGLVK